MSAPGQSVKENLIRFLFVTSDGACCVRFVLVFYYCGGGVSRGRGFYT